MEWILGTLGTLSLGYLFLGVIMALYEKMQTDNKFDIKTIVTWGYKIFK